MLSHLVQERIILENALDSLKAFLHIEMMWTQDSGLDKGLDGFLTIKTQTFPIEVKNEFKMNQLPRLDIQKQQHPNLILIANVLPEKIKSILRENKINYLDTAGNSYISSSDGLIFVDGQKPVAKPEINKDKAFTKKGLVIVFHLLNDETLLNATYRKIAETTQTSLDTVTKVFQSLRQQGFIQSIDTQTMRLIEKKRLFEKWADGCERPTLGNKLDCRLRSETLRSTAA